MHFHRIQKKTASAGEVISKTKHQTGIGNAEINVKAAYKNNQNKIQTLGREVIRLNVKLNSESKKMNIENLQMHSDSETNDSNSNSIDGKMSSNILDILNDDCIRAIFRLLPREDLISVADVCTRFQNNAKVMFATRFTDVQLFTSNH